MLLKTKGDFKNCIESEPKPNNPMLVNKIGQKMSRSSLKIRHLNKPS